MTNDNASTDSKMKCLICRNPLGACREPDYPGGEGVHQIQRNLKAWTGRKVRGGHVYGFPIFEEGAYEPVGYLQADGTVRKRRGGPETGC